MLPVRREHEVLVQELPNETLVYDLKRNKAHCLNRVAGLVWRHCDGRMTVAEMVALLHNELQIPADEHLVGLALDQLERAHLLQDSIIPAADLSKMSRRDLVAKLGVAGVLVPLVISVTAPAAKAAASCGSIGASCGGANKPCCQGLTCVGGISEVYLCTSPV